MTYTKDFIVEQQTIGAACPDCILDTMQDNYTIIDIDIKNIKVDGCAYPHITKHNWVELHGYGNDDNNGLDVITNLMNRYKQGLEVHPIILDSDFEILDGLHRYVAAYTLGLTTMKGYYPL
jgi:hypothetical protein